MPRIKGTVDRIGNKPFADWLFELRSKVGLSTAQVSKSLGISIGYITNLEKGVTHIPDDRVLIALSKLYNVSEVEMIIRAGKMPEDYTKLIVDLLFKNRRYDGDIFSLKDISTMFTEYHSSNIGKYGWQNIFSALRQKTSLEEIVDIAYSTIENVKKYADSIK